MAGSKIATSFAFIAIIVGLYGLSYEGNDGHFTASILGFGFAALFFLMRLLLRQTER